MKLNQHINEYNGDLRDLTEEQLMTMLVNINYMEVIKIAKQHDLTDQCQSKVEIMNDI